MSTNFDELGNRIVDTLTINFEGAGEGIFALTEPGVTGPLPSTFGPAHVMGIDTDTGSIEAGKYADMIVLDRDLTAIEPMTIKDTRVLKTVFAGELVYESDGKSAALPKIPTRPIGNWAFALNHLGCNHPWHMQRSLKVFN